MHLKNAPSRLLLWSKATALCRGLLASILASAPAAGPLWQLPLLSPLRSGLRTAGTPSA